MRFDCTKSDNFVNLVEFSNKLRNTRMTITGGFDHSPEAIEQLVLSEFWPKAVPESLIVKSQDAITHRSKSIIGSFVGNLNGKKFLDFGCGNGLCAAAAATSAALSVGYDIVKDEAWADTSVQLSTDWEEVKKHGHFDVVLLYDVFDHVQESHVPTILKQISEISNKDTIIRVRCHPWTSIHGGHLYENLNRAYAHLFLTDAQITKYQTSPVRKITRPMKVYADAWAAGGFNVDKTETHKTNWDHNNIGKFFQEPDVALFINKQSPQQVLGTARWQKDVLPIEFIDFTLSKK